MARITDLPPEILRAVLELLDMKSHARADSELRLIYGDSIPPRPKTYSLCALTRIGADSGLVASYLYKAKIDLSMLEAAKTCTLWHEIVLGILFETRLSDESLFRGSRGGLRAGAGTLVPKTRKDKIERLKLFERTINNVDKYFLRLEKSRKARTTTWSV